MMKIKHPIAYELTPQDVRLGMRWVTLRLRNTGEEELTRLDVRLNTLDTYRVDVYGTGTFIQSLEPGEVVEVPFQIAVNGLGDVYATLDGWRDDQPFHWESGHIPITAGRKVAELVSLFALTEPRAPLGEPIEVEATVRSLEVNSQLVVEFWSETPSGESLSLAKEGLGNVSAGEEMRVTTEFTPTEEGMYVLHAYLYDGLNRIGHRTEHLSISL
jgi:hypothetical protein